MSKLWNKNNTSAGHVYQMWGKAKICHDNITEKKTVEKQGLKILGNILVIIGILLFVGLVANFITIFMVRNQWQAARHLSGAIRCGIFGAIFLSLELSVKRKAKGNWWYQ